MPWMCLEGPWHCWGLQGSATVGPLILQQTGPGDSQHCPQGQVAQQQCHLRFNLPWKGQELLGPSGVPEDWCEVCVLHFPRKGSPVGSFAPVPLALLPAPLAAGHLLLPLSHFWGQPGARDGHRGPQGAPWCPQQLQAQLLPGSEMRKSEVCLCSEGSVLPSPAGIHHPRLLLPWGSLEGSGASRGP